MQIYPVLEEILVSQLLAALNRYEKMHKEEEAIRQQQKNDKLIDTD